MRHMDHLKGAFRTLHEHVATIRLTLSEDIPGVPGDSPALIDLLEDTCDTLTGALEDVLAKLESDPSLSLEATARTTMFAHTHLCDVREQVAAQFTTWERFTQLYVLSERRGEWSAWVWTLAAQLERLQRELALAERALLALWSDLSEHLMSGVLVRATNIGQLSVPLTAQQEGCESAAELPRPSSHPPHKEVPHGPKC